MPLRFDTGKVDSTKITRTPQGGIRVPAAIARTGILEYKLIGGGVRRELRLAEDVFHADAMATANNAPVTNLHPGKMVDPSSYRQVNVGHVAEGTVRQDADKLVADLIIQDGDFSELVLTKERSDVSCGYMMDLDETPGTWQGKPYDARQVNIRINHVGIGPVGWGRSGTDVGLRLDSAGEQLPPNGNTPKDQDMECERIDGVKYEVGSEPHKAAVARRDAAAVEAQAVHTKAQADLTAATQRADAAEASLQGRDVSALANARADLLMAARDAGVEIRKDGKDLSDDEIRKGLIAKATPSVDLTGKDAAYLAAAADMAIGKIREDAAGKLRNDGSATGAPESTAAARMDAALKASAEARDKMISDGQNAWRGASTAAPPK